MNESKSTADVLIIGGGPAGAVCGLRLRQDPLGRQRRVIIVERDPFPRYKVCGCCFNGAGQAVLESVGCGSLLEDLGAVPLNRWEARFQGRRVDAALPTGWALSREAMDQALIDRAREAGVEIVQPASAKILDNTAEATRVQISTTDGQVQQIDARVVVFAGGLAGGNIEQWLPWKQSPAGPAGAGASFVSRSDNYQPGTIYMACSQSGYAGIVALENGRLDVAAAIYDPRGQFKSLPLGVRVAEIITASGMPEIPEMQQRDNSAAIVWKGTPLLHRQRIVGRDGLLAIGDAAGYVEPFTGEGMAWAVQTAKIAADCIVKMVPRSATDGARVRREVSEEYSHAYRRILTKRRLPCRMVTTALRHKTSRSLLFSTLATAPWLAKPFIGRINHA